MSPSHKPRTVWKDALKRLPGLFCSPAVCGEQRPPQTHFRCTFTSDLFSAFIHQIASQGLARFGVWNRVEGTPRGERKRGKRAIWTAAWAIFKHFSWVLTCSDQTRHTGRGPCSREGKLLMPQPQFPCRPPVHVRLGVVTKFVQKQTCLLFQIK